MKEKNETFSISQVSQMAGVSKNRIRERHDEGSLPQVEWIPVGTRNHRRFTQDDIKLITKIDAFVKSHFLCFLVIPAKAGIRAPGSRRDLRGESPLPGDAHSR